MNIFVTDPDPIKSAQVLPDKTYCQDATRNMSDACYRSII